MTPDQAGAASRKAVARLGTAYLECPRTLRRARELGLTGWAAYVAGRGGALGDVRHDTVASALGLIAPDAVRNGWLAARAVLAPPEVAGILNLRGRVVTAIDMRSRLDLGARAKDAPVMAIGIEVRSESYGLLVDSVGEVMALDNSTCEPKPANLDERLWRVAAGIYRLEGQLLVVLDVDRVLDIKNGAVAA